MGAIELHRVALFFPLKYDQWVANKPWSSLTEQQKEARRAYNRKRYHEKHKNDPKFRARQKARNRKGELRKSQVFHWLTTDQFKQAYERFFKKQKGLCNICGKKATEDRRLDLDHCHESKRLRGLLCIGCNTKLGWFETYEAEIYEHLN